MKSWTPEVMEAVVMLNLSRKVEHSQEEKKIKMFRGLLSHA